MFRSLWLGLFVCLVSALSVQAQTTSASLPTSVDILVLPATGNPTSVAPLGTKTTVIGSVNTTTGAVTGNAQCGRTATAGSPPPPLVNPTQAEFDDPFAAGKKCVAPLPTGLPDGVGYRASAVFTAPSCQPIAGGPVVSPCPSKRSQVGVPPFTLASIRTAPVDPTALVVLP